MFVSYLYWKKKQPSTYANVNLEDIKSGILDSSICIIGFDLFCVSASSLIILLQFFFLFRLSTVSIAKTLVRRRQEKKKHIAIGRN